MAITLFLFVTRLRDETNVSESPEDGPCEVSEMLVISLNLVANKASIVLWYIKWLALNKREKSVYRESIEPRTHW